MSLKHIPVPTFANYGQPNVANTRISGYRLLIARIVLLATSVLNLILFIAGVPVYFAYLHSLPSHPLH